MLNLQAMQLMHPHGDHGAPMAEVGPPDPAARDEEREWLHGARIFRCTECNEQVVVGPSEPSRGAAEEDR